MGFLDRFRSNKVDSMPEEEEVCTDVPEGEDEVSLLKKQLWELQTVHARFSADVLRLMPSEITNEVRAGKPLPEAVSDFIKKKMET